MFINVFMCFIKRFVRLCNELPAGPRELTIISLRLWVDIRGRRAAPANEVEIPAPFKLYQVVIMQIHR